jgi:hypothetical protein
MSQDAHVTSILATGNVCLFVSRIAKTMRRFHLAPRCCSLLFWTRLEQKRVPAALNSVKEKEEKREPWGGGAVRKDRKGNINFLPVKPRDHLLLFPCLIPQPRPPPRALHPAKNLAVYV